MQENELQRLAQDYQAHIDLDQHLAFYQQIPTIEQSIEYATLAKQHNGKRHPHQRLLARQTLHEVKLKLLMKKQQLENAPCFETVLAIVQSSAVSGFGELACYDTALRLGVRLDRLPEHVYLHCGTRKGASRLGLPVDQKYILVSELPNPLCTIKPYQVEDFLCINKSFLSCLETTDEVRIRSCVQKADEKKVSGQECH